MASRGWIFFCSAIKIALLNPTIVVNESVQGKVEK
jgi:hypothetical protein